MKRLEQPKQRTEFIIMRYSGDPTPEIVYWGTTETLVDISLILEEQKQKWPVEEQLSVFIRAS